MVRPDVREEPALFARHRSAEAAQLARAERRRQQRPRDGSRRELARVGRCHRRGGGVVRGLRNVQPPGSRQISLLASPAQPSRSGS